MSGRYCAGLVSSCSRKTPSRGDLGLAPGGRPSTRRRCRPGRLAPWRGRRMTRTSWQKYLPPNCAPMPVPLRQLAAPRLELEVADGVAAARCRASAGRRGSGSCASFTVFSVDLGRRAADDDGQVVRRAGGGAERADLLVEERQQRLRVQQRLGLLEEERLVRRAAALGDEQEVVLVAAGARRARSAPAGWSPVLSSSYMVERRHLRVAQVGLGVGVEDAARERRLVVAALVQTRWPFLPMTIAVPVSWQRRQHHAGRDVGVLQHVERDEAVVRRRLGVVEDVAQLRQVAGAEQVRDVADRLGGEPRQRRARRREHALAAERVGRDPSPRRASGRASCRAPCGNISWNWNSGMRASLLAPS